ncbi:DUF6643 family protein [Streptomyces sp. NPDC051940]|uniref:DUF6643 family protein n=1 Tax=Streptomyces sp. NPDC051940 TaxID=3155675 RepID=UPI003418E137
MTSPRSYGGGYYAPSFPDTPIYDSLVAERGTPQIAPIRVPSYDSGSSLPALPAPRPALPAAPAQHQPAYQQPSYQQQHTPPRGYPAAPQPAAPQPFIPQQQTQPARYAPQQQARPALGPATGPSTVSTGYEAMRPVQPRPAPAPQQAQTYNDPYGRPYQQQPYNGRGY